MPSANDGPMLDKVKVSFESVVAYDTYPFCVPIIKNLQDISFPTQVTFLVGENGGGKSTLLEAIAYKSGFGLEGVSKNIGFTTAEAKVYEGVKDLASCTTLSWRRKPTRGYLSTHIRLFCWRIPGL